MEFAPKPRARIGVIHPVTLDEFANTNVSGAGNTLEQLLRVHPEVKCQPGMIVTTGSNAAEQAEFFFGGGGGTTVPRPYWPYTVSEACQTFRPGATRTMVRGVWQLMVFPLHNQSEEKPAHNFT